MLFHLQNVMNINSSIVFVLQLGPHGYAFMITEHGHVLFHPNFHPYYFKVSTSSKNHENMNSGYFINLFVIRETNIKFNIIFKLWTWVINFQNIHTNIIYTLITCSLQLKKNNSGYKFIYNVINFIIIIIYYNFISRKILTNLCY